MIGVLQSVAGKVLRICNWNARLGLGWDASSGAHVLGIEPQSVDFERFRPCEGGSCEGDSLVTAALTALVMIR